jgi:FkbM family methyltransferase
VQGVPIETFSHFGELALIYRLRPGQVVVHLGANIGYFTLLFARQVGHSGHVYAFEPGPLSFLLLKKYIAANAYRNITPINKAVSDKSEILDLWICVSGESDNCMDGVERGDDDRFPVMTRCVALDDELPRRLIVDYIKMDVQGAEYPALLGMRGLIERSPQISLLMEWDTILV